MPLLLSGLRLVLHVRKVMGQLGTAQCARTYSFQSRILPTGYKVIKINVSNDRQSWAKGRYSGVRAVVTVRATMSGTFC